MTVTTPKRRLDRALGRAMRAPNQGEGVLRVVVGAYAVVSLLIRLPAHLDHSHNAASRWEPVGVLASFSSPLPDALVVALAIVTPVLAVAFASGWRLRMTGPVFAVALLVVTTLDSSWGQVFHTENLLVLYVVVLVAAPPPVRVRLCALVLVATYVAAGIAKLRIGGIDWLDGDVLRHHVAHDNVRKALLGDWHSPIGEAAVAHRWLFPPMAIATIVVELGAPVALLGGRWRTAWVVSAWLFHAGVLALMAVLFPFQLSLVGFAPLLLLSTSAPASPDVAAQPSGTQMVQSGSASATGPAPP